MNTAEGSAPYSPPFCRTQAITRLASIRYSGNDTAGLRRQFALMHTHPWFASR